MICPPGDLRAAPGGYAHAGRPNVCQHGHVTACEVTFLDSTGITILVAGHHQATAHGLTYSVTNPHGMVRRTLDVTGVLGTLTETT